MVHDLETMRRLNQAAADKAAEACRSGFGIEVRIDMSELDGTPLVFINAPENAKGPKLRIWLNDETVWENPSVPVLPDEDSE